jgi:hypothetical protein
MMVCGGMRVKRLEIIAASLGKMTVLIIELDTTNNEGGDRLTLIGKDICNLTSFCINYKQLIETYLLTTNKIHSPDKCKYLLFYVIHSPTCFRSN